MDGSWTDGVTKTGEHRGEVRCSQISPSTQILPVTPNLTSLPLAD